jgi:flagellar protein FlbD
MIILRRLNQTSVVVNIAHIVTITSTPDTLITLFGGEKLLVKETPHEVIEKIQSFIKDTLTQEHTSFFLSACATSVMEK